MWHSPAVARAWTLVVGSLLVWAALAPSIARAYDRQIGLTLELGYAVTPSGPLPPHGIYAEGGASIGLGDTWEIRGRLAYAWHPQPMHRWAGGVELVYLIDILEVVPFLGLGVCGIVTLNDTSVLGDFAANAVIGLDVLLSREATLGFVVRPSVLFTSLDTSPVWLEAGARLQYLIPY
jgi:hypothetical protein